MKLANFCASVFCPTGDASPFEGSQHRSALFARIMANQELCLAFEDEIGTRRPLKPPGA